MYNNVNENNAISPIHITKTIDSKLILQHAKRNVYRKQIEFIYKCAVQYKMLAFFFIQFQFFSIKFICLGNN